MRWIADNNPSPQTESVHGLLYNFGPSPALSARGDRLIVKFEFR